MSQESPPGTEPTRSDSCLFGPYILSPVTLSFPAAAESPPTRSGEDILPERGDSSMPPTRVEHTASAGSPAANRIGRYEVRGEIGRGGMGAVLRGRDPTLGRDLAIKVLLGDLRGNAEARRRFHEEAQIGGQLQHPGLVPVYEFDADAEG